jgi:hypothetical protein
MLPSAQVDLDELEGDFLLVQDENYTLRAGRERTSVKSENHGVSEGW